MIVAPIADLVADLDQLVVVPDGALHYVPFEALVSGISPSGEAEYLLERWAIAYAPSASTLVALQGRARAGESARALDLVAFADPALPGALESADGLGVLRGVEDVEEWRWRSLQGARREVEAIAKLFGPERTKIFMGPEASEARFRQSGIDDTRFVHVAAHAFIDDREPALSSLLFAQDEGSEEDGLLQAHEVFDLKLNAELVVLSGCETALGKAVRGEGLVGLVQAFLHSGAGAVSVSLWPVEDQSTADLMAGFYSELSRGVGGSQALRRAKLARLQGGSTAHPYYWAPFVLVGASS